MKLSVISFEQPAGNFFLSAMSANELIRISRADPRKFDKVSLETVGGIQREPSSKRIKEIADYANTVDAAFPTPILLALDSGSYALKNGQIEITGDKIADIVDGQHRVLGIKDSIKLSDFTIPVVFMLDATEEQKALIFATINGKQTKVPASLIYDLFGVTKTRSPQKTAHEVARALNSTASSPWYKRLKMLGKKTPGSAESLSQGTFIQTLLPHISADPTTDMDRIKKGQQPLVHSKCIFNDYFRKGDDSSILKILLNVFQGVRSAWPAEWDNPSEYILTKTTGFSGIMKALPTMINRGRSNNNLSREFFEALFNAVKKDMNRENYKLTNDFFHAGSAGESDFRDRILKQLK